ncbi:MAG: sigma-70 family RNA polymerase sigma factor [Anaerolineaceae bacterium]|nr:sigma-70 family RNA polymerase sigma factor [Anaerolineaceae bacterium]
MHADLTPENAGSVRLKQYIETETDWLLPVLRFYLFKAGLLYEEGFVTELLDEMVVEALQNAKRFDPTRQPKAWLLGIAANLIKRKRAQAEKLERREPLAGDLAIAKGDDISEDEIFDRLSVFSGEDLEKDMLSKHQLLQVLSLIPIGDRQLIRLYVMTGLEGNALASELNISAGAARVRLHRALNRLRKVWRANQEVDRYE